MKIKTINHSTQHNSIKKHSELGKARKNKESSSPRDILVQIGVGEHTPHTLARAYEDKFQSIEELRYVDLNPEHLDAVAATCRALNKETGRNVKCVVSTDYKDALEDATMVSFAFAVDYPQSTLRDYARAERHGIPMVEGETMGIGGGLAGIRHLKVAMPIMDRMASVCPDAWCVVSTNPIRHLGDYAARYAKLRKCMGLCHGAEATIQYIENAAGIKHGLLDFLVAGANHFIWYLKIWSRETGEDYYPKLTEILKKQALDGEMSRHMFQTFGIYPGNGPSHVTDSFGLFTEDIWKKYDIHRALSAERGATGDHKRWTNYMRKIRDGQMTAREYLKELAVSQADAPASPILRSFLKTDTMYYNQALNIPNRGAVSNLPDDAIIEVPGVSNRTGAYPLVVGPLPDAVAELVRRQVVIQKLHVDAAATGSKQALTQALLLDPTVKSFDSAMAFLNDTLTEDKKFYPVMS